MRNPDRNVGEFLACNRIAVVGVSREGQSPANLIYRKLVQAGRQVFAVNPHAQPAVIVTRPEVAASVVDDCAASGVRWVWLHRSFGQGSVSDEAIERCRVHGINVIPGGCPIMHCAPVDPGHACMRAVLRLFGRLPVPVPGLPPGADGDGRGARARPVLPPAARNLAEHRG